MPGAESEQVGNRIRETYDDLCSLERPRVGDIARTWSRRVIWPVAHQLVVLGLAWAECPIMYASTRLVMFPWSETRFLSVQDIRYATTTVLAESRKS